MAGSGQPPPKLSPEELTRAQRDTLASPRIRYPLSARLLFLMMDVVYGRTRTVPKFRILELIARVPYQAWEQVAFVAITHIHSEPHFARRIHDRVLEARAQEDNEQWHLFILEEMLDERAYRRSLVRDRLLPQVVAFAYYHLSWLLFVMRPAWSYRLNAAFEDHAEHEYMAFVDEHPDLEAEPFTSSFADDYGHFASLADLFRQIGHDERVHKDESLARMRAPRFT